MMDPLRLEPTLLPASAGDATSSPEAPDADSFGDLLTQSMEEVNRLQTQADQAVQDFATGAEPDIHRTMIAMTKAEVSFQLMMQVRNKAVSAYEEIARMQI